jgi:hypothetical protein
MTIQLSTLTDAECIGLLRLMARRWFEHDGVSALIVYQKVEGCLKEHEVALPGWLEGPAQGASVDLARASRAALQAIADGEDEVAKKWIEEEIADLETAHGHMFDPLTLSILGATLIGSILAARVKKIGSVEFYQGIPPELAKVLKTVAPVVSKS